MAESSGFFASVNGDRRYKTDWLAEYIRAIISDGVLDGTMAVTATGDNMQVQVLAGKGWILGYLYSNDSTLPLNIGIADGALPRIDTVVLRLDRNARSIHAYVVQGIPATAPEAKEPIRNSEVHELVLAYVRVEAGATSITQSAIADKRLDNGLCGIVHAVIEQINTTDLLRQIEDWFELYKQQADKDLETFEATFLVWFEGVKGQLSTDAAGHLQNQMDAANARITNEATYVYTGRLLVDGWTAGTDEQGTACWTQTVAAANRDGGPPLTASTQLFGPMDLPTGVRETDEVLAEVLRIVNDGKPTPGEGTVTCKVWELPEADAQIYWPGKAGETQ